MEKTNDNLTLGRRSFIGGGAAFFVAAGLGHSAFGAAGGTARLRVGVLSDVHVIGCLPGANANAGSCETFEKALRYFCSRGVDAVVIAGDMADNGLESQLRGMGDAWRRVFPGNKRPDGGHVEKVFVTGNHDVEGWKYGYAKQYGITEAKNADDILALHMAESWKRVFDEEYSPMYIKDVKGTINGFRHEPLNALLKVPEMKARFLTRFAEVLETAFLWPYVESKFAPWEAILEELLPRQNKRWPYLTMKRWRTNVNATKYYARVRPKKIVSMLQKRMKLTDAEVETYFGRVQALLEEQNTVK